MFLLCLLSLFGHLVKGSITDCSNGASLFSVRSMSFSPDPMVQGQNSTLRLSLLVPQTITDGTATYTVTYNFFPLTPTVNPLCTTTVPCPITPGILDTYSSYPPTGLSGSMQIRIIWKDGTGKQLLCINIKTGV